MSAARTKALGRLEAAERLFGLRLKAAQLEQALSEHTLAVELRKKTDIERERARLDAYRRELLDASRPLQTAALEHATRYGAWVAARLDEQLAVVTDASSDCDEKRGKTRACFEDITVLRRVCERRREFAELERERQAQRLLDSLAALKLSSEIVRNNRNKR